MAVKKETNLTLGISESEKVDAFMSQLQHPLADVAAYIRSLILGVDKSVGEGIYWNVPTFYFTGKMKPFDPKDYKRYLVGFNFFKQDCLRLIFLKGADANDSSGLLEGTYADGRRLAHFKSIAEVKAREKDLKKIIKTLISQME